MILEIAQIDVKPGMENDFEAGVKAAAPLFKRAKGCKSMALQRSHENPQRYRLFVLWETLGESHQGFPQIPPISRNGASWSATASHRRRTSSM